jgi:8-amino-3,8-dideoxy-alpha-D-manno-octulosonate transaminase
MPGYELLGDDELASVAELFSNNTYLMRHAGPLDKFSPVNILEAKFASYIGSQSSLLVSSGSTAIKLSLQAVGVERDTFVVTQPFTFIATFEAILELNAIPVVLPIDDYLGLSPVHLSAFLKENHNRVSAVLPVHMLGEACVIDKIVRICSEYSIPVIEDNCEALGGSYNGIKLGNHGCLGIYSFDYGKIITSGEGGLITGSRENINQCFALHDHGHTYQCGNRAQELPSRQGFNYRYSELHASILLPQYAKLQYILASNKERYNAISASLHSYQRPCRPNSIPSYDTFMFKVISDEQLTKVFNIMDRFSISTKNIPSAMNWHCSKFWPHLSFIDYLDASAQSFNILSRYISIPILLAKSVDFYYELGRSILSSLL